MPLRHLTGGTVAATAWIMPDGSIAQVKLTQAEWDKGEYDLRPPDPKARRVFGIGGIPALDTVDGFPSPGDYWEAPAEDPVTGDLVTALHIQSGTDLFGNWSYAQDQQHLDAQGKQVVDAVSKIPMREWVTSIAVTHREVRLVYNLGTAAQIVPAPPASAVSTRVTPYVPPPPSAIAIGGSIVKGH